MSTRGANRNPEFRNSETVIPNRYSDGQQLILSDNFGQTPVADETFIRKKTGKLNVDCHLKKNTCHINTQYMKHRKKRITYYLCHASTLSLLLVFGQFPDTPVLRTVF